MKPAYTVGRTIRKSPEFPDGVPCILWDGDSVLCEFPSAIYGESRAAHYKRLAKKRKNIRARGKK